MIERITFLAFVLLEAISIPCLAQSWSGNTAGIGNQSINCFAVKPQSNGRVVFVGCQANAGLPTLWRTSNGGTTWQPARYFSENPITIKSIVFDAHNAHTILVYGSQEHTAWRSLDGGETWVRRIESTRNLPPSHTLLPPHDSTYIVWEPAQHISNSPLLEASPRPQVSGNNVFLMWRTPSAAYSFFARSSDHGTRWNNPAILPDSTEGTGNWFYSSNIFAVAPPFVYFSTRYMVGVVSRLWFRRWLIEDSTWGEGRALFDSTAPDMLCARGTDVVLSYRTNPQVFAPFFASSVDSGTNWTRFPAHLPLEGPVLTMSQSSMHSYIARIGQVFGRSEVEFSVSTDRGKTWRPEVFLSSLDAILSDQPHLAGDSLGNVCAVWRDAKYGSTTGWNATILFRRSTDYGQTWLPEQIITPEPTGTFSHVSTNGQTVVIVWDDERIVGGETVVSVRGRASFDQGQTWSGEFMIAPPPEGGGDSDVLVSGDLVHVAWAEYVPGYHGDIFYRRGRIISTGITPSGVKIPNEVRLMQNYPNPFNPTTRISYAIPSAGVVEFKVFDLLGREVRTLVNEFQKEGRYEVVWDGRDSNSRNAASGVYFYRFTAGSTTLQRKMLLLK